METERQMPGTNLYTFTDNTLKNHDADLNGNYSISEHHEELSTKKRKFPEGGFDESPTSTKRSKKESVDESSRAPMDVEAPATQVFQLPEQIFDVLRTNNFTGFDSATLVSLSETCWKMCTHSYEEREKRAQLIRNSLMIAVAQGNETEAKRLIEQNPMRLFDKKGRAQDFVGRHFENMTPFQAALCTGDMEMCEMMRKYFMKVQNGKAEMQAQLDEVFPYGVYAHLAQQKEDAFNFSTILQAIKDAPNNEIQAALNKQFDADLPLIHALNQFRKDFREKALSETVFNPVHILKAREIYAREFDDLGNWDKRDLFWRQVIGYTQRLAPAPYKQAFAQGIFYITGENESLRRSFDFRWGGGTILAGLDSDSSGEGFDHATSEGARRTHGASRGEIFQALGALVPRFSKLISDKNIKLERTTWPGGSLWYPCVIL